MKFTYTYRSSDGQRHTAEIEAPSRDEAFAAIRRERGIKPIKVVADEPSAAPAENGSEAKSKSVAGKVLLAIAVLAIIGGTAWWFSVRKPPETITIATPQGPVTYTMAAPLPRQTIPGDRARIDAAHDKVFQSSAERLLARFAEPGRAVSPIKGNLKPTEDEFRASLREPVRVANTDFTEVVDLKRIVSGMKKEMRTYLAGGGTVAGYVAELEKRQRLEVSYRERAEQKLKEMLNGKDSRSDLRAAYAYWLKANAQLQAMGIYPLTIPDALRSYQMGMDIDE